jgi:hypothetical protein
MRSAAWPHFPGDYTLAQESAIFASKPLQWEKG